MKIIFLDIDGVLNANNPSSKSHYKLFSGIDSDKLKQLARIVQQTDAKIVLTSSWKTNWRPALAPYKHEPGTAAHTRYLNNHLQKQNITIFDVTRERNHDYRGGGIRKWLDQHPEVTSWVVLDDEVYIDYKETHILPSLVQIDTNNGLTFEKANLAIQMLNKSKGC